MLHFDRRPAEIAQPDASSRQIWPIGCWRFGRSAGNHHRRIDAAWPSTLKAFLTFQEHHALTDNHSRRRRRIPVNSHATTADAMTDEAGAAKKGGSKKLVLLAVPLLLVGLVAGLWFSGILPPLLGMGEKHEEAEKHGAKPGEKAGAPGDLKAEAEAKAKIPVFIDMPEIVANLNVGQRRSSFVKMKIKLEIGRAEDVAAITAAMPRLQDMFTTYLRETRPEELRGSAGSYRLREELIGRANIAVTPLRVVDILFTEMLVQ
jgi:flagellar FliL protein